MKYTINCRVKPVIRFNTSKDQFKNLISIYGSSFAQLMNQALNTTLTPTEYSKLPTIRKLMNEVDKDQEKLLDTLSKGLASGAVKKIIDIFPLFLVSPVELKSYILLTLGFLVEEC